MRVADRLSRDTADSLQQYYLNTVSFWNDHSGLVRNAEPISTVSLVWRNCSPPMAIRKDG